MVSGGRESAARGVVLISAMGMIVGVWVMVKSVALVYHSMALTKHRVMRQVGGAAGE